MKKTFLTYTAAVELLTGIVLIFIPSKVAGLLLDKTLDNPIEILLAMLAGVAIFSIALCAWLARSQVNSSVTIIMLLSYNVAVAFVFLYSSMTLGFAGAPIWAIIIFHLIQSVISIRIILKMQSGK